LPGHGVLGGRGQCPRHRWLCVRFLLAQATNGSAGGYSTLQTIDGTRVGEEPWSIEDDLYRLRKQMNLVRCGVQGTRNLAP